MLLRGGSNGLYRGKAVEPPSSPAVYLRAGSGLDGRTSGFPPRAQTGRPASSPGLLQAGAAHRQVGAERKGCCAVRYRAGKRSAAATQPKCSAGAAEAAAAAQARGTGDSRRGGSDLASSDSMSKRLRALQGGGAAGSGGGLRSILGRGAESAAGRAAGAL